MGLQSTTEEMGQQALRLRKCLDTLCELAVNAPDTRLGDSDVAEVLSNAHECSVGIVAGLYGKDAV